MMVEEVDEGEQLTFSTRFQHVAQACGRRCPFKKDGNRAQTSCVKVLILTAERTIAFYFYKFFSKGN